MKRFTDTGKFDDTWYSELAMQFKLAWDYALAKCDSAGIWEPNMKLANFQIGGKVDWDGFLAAAAGRIVVLPNGKWWLTGFVKFQYGKLSQDARVHQAVIKNLENNGIGIDANGIPIPSGWVQEKDKEKEQEKEKEGRSAEEGPSAAAEVYDAYPKKAGRAEALKHIRAALKTVPAARLLERTRAYAGAVAKWPPGERHFVPDPERWYRKGRWDDDPQTWEYRITPAAAGGLDKTKTIGLTEEEMPLVYTP